MAPAGDGCPGDAVIEQIALEETGGSAWSAHIAGCERCRERLAEARDDAAFIDRVRPLVAPHLGPDGAPRLAGYRVLGVVSSGAQGIVYRAVQESTSRMVAIKLLLIGEGVSPGRRFRAEREAEIAARLRHPNIVSVFESRVLPDGRIAMVMEFVDGVPLDRWRPASAARSEAQRELLRVMMAVCSGIHHAHLNGVIHRDLKPDNILVTREGRPVVLDFGIAKAGETRATITGEFAGTPAYASPEQVAGHPEEVDALTDVYSLGVILYRLLCGALPYKVEGSIFDMARTISDTEPTPPRAADPSLPQDLEAILLRALHKRKDRRYQSAAALERDIERFLAGQPVEARSGSGWYLLRKAVMVNRRRLGAAAAAAALLVAAVGAVVVSSGRAREAAREARLQHELASAERVRARAVTELLREVLPNVDPVRPGLDDLIGLGLGRLFFRLETGGYADDPELDQALRRMWGQVYTGLGAGKAVGLVEYAEVSIRNGLERLRRAHGGDHAEVASTLHELAGVLLIRGRLQEAEAVCREALAMHERLFGSESERVTGTRGLLARVLSQRGATTEAASIAEGVIRASAGRDDRTTDLLVASMCDLKAAVLPAEGAGAEREALLREALRRRLTRLRAEDPELRGSLAACAEHAERHPEGPLARMMRAAWGDGAAPLPALVERDLPLLAASDHGFHYARTPAGRSAALGRLIVLQSALIGEEHPAVVDQLIAQMRSARSEDLDDLRAGAALRAAELLTRRFGDLHPAALVCLEEAALVLALDGRAAEAVPPARQACAIRDAVPAHARDALLTANTRRKLGWFLALAGRCEEALPVCRQAVEEFTAAVGDEHHTTALAKSVLAFCLAETGDLPEAVRTSRAAHETAMRLGIAAMDQLAHIRFVHGHVMGRAGEHEEAREPLRHAWNIYYRFLGPGYAWRGLLIDAAAASAEAAGDAHAAEAWRRRRDKAPGEEVAAPDRGRPARWPRMFPALSSGATPRHPRAVAMVSRRSIGQGGRAKETER